jgi:hypothetical protein
MNKLGLYGAPEMILIHGDPRVRYPTEVEACGRIYDPNAPRFEPAPRHSTDIWCPGHKDFEQINRFSPDPKRPNGRRGYCKACERRREKEARAKRHRAASPERWYRG